MTAGQSAKNELAPLVGLFEQIQMAKSDVWGLNKLITNYIPFIKSCISTAPVKSKSDSDNLSNAMLAFASSVKNYNPEHGTFLNYANVAICNRLMDSFRKEQLARKRFFVFSPTKNYVEAETALRAYYREQEEQRLSDEIKEINAEFAEWGFSWAALQKKGPKQKRSRKTALRIAKTVLQNSDLLNKTVKKRQLPILHLSQLFPRKILEKHRHYIISLIILLQGNYPHLYLFIYPFIEEV